jgi:hypothetical protein
MEQFAHIVQGIAGAAIAWTGLAIAWRIGRPCRGGAQQREPDSPQVPKQDAKEIVRI